MRTALVSTFLLLALGAFGCTAVVDNKLGDKPGEPSELDIYCTDKPDNTPCADMPPSICVAGHGCPLASCCVLKGCGDGFVDTAANPPEECDDGNAISGDGCEPNCTFSCESTAECDDGDPCNGDETCNEEHFCTHPAFLPDSTPCVSGGTAGTCMGGTCVPL